jgi:hypothetical protein
LPDKTEENSGLGSRCFSSVFDGSLPKKFKKRFEILIVYSSGYIFREEEKQFQLQNFKEMIQFILMLLGLAFGHNNAHTSTCHNNQTVVTVQSDTDPGSGINPGDGEPVGGNTGQLPPPSPTNP